MWRSVVDSSSQFSTDTIKGGYSRSFIALGKMIRASGMVAEAEEVQSKPVTASVGRYREAKAVRTSCQDDDPTAKNTATTPPLTPSVEGRASTLGIARAQAILQAQDSFKLTLTLLGDATARPQKET